MIRYISYTLLPSGSIYKLESAVNKENIDDIIRGNTISIVYPDLNYMFYDKQLLRFCMPQEECKEIIKAIKLYIN